MWRAAVIVAGLAAALGGPARALCTADLMTAAERREFGFTPAADWFPQRGDRPAPGWVFYLTHDRPTGRDTDGHYNRDSWRLVLEHCVSRDRMVAWVATPGQDRATFGHRYEALAFGIFNLASTREAQSCTLDDLAAWVRGQGERAELGRASYVSCVCAGQRAQVQGG